MRTKYSIKNSVMSFVNTIVNFVFLFIAQKLFIKILGIEYNGLNGLFTNILTFLNLFELGIGSAINYHLYKYIKVNDIKTIKSIMTFYKKAYRIISIMIFMIGLLFIPFLRYIVKDITVNINIIIVYLLFLLTTISTYIISYKRNLLFAYQKNYFINIINILYIIVLNISQIFVIYFTKNYYLYLIIKIVCIIIENIIINIKVNKDYPYMKEKNNYNIDAELKSDIFNKVRALMIHKISSSVTNGTDNILISIFIGIKTVGLYTNYNYIISSIKKLFQNFVYATMPSIGNLLVENDCEKNYLIFKKISFINFWITTFTSVCLFMLIRPFISIWIGDKYLLSEFVSIILVTNYYQDMMRNSYNIFKDAAGIWVDDKYIPVLQILINLFCSIILLKIIGLAGVFLGTIISRLVLWFYSYPKYVYKKLFNKTYADYYKELLLNMLVTIIIMLSTYFISNIFIISSSTIQLFINGLICLIVPNLTMYLLYRKNAEFKYYMKLIKKIINKKTIQNNYKSIN
ncbi:MAG: oligosaccharide flippase family protein [Bacilli bacterium]|nr:oligosaccharide flippase family protein [Bacilli bacterium]